jgi:class 3 adenylate cyclase
MPLFRATAVMKTDIGNSTPRFRALRGADLAAFLAEHREFVRRVAMAEEGTVIKSEGDAFWLAFPSTTAAARAALAMQEELRHSQANKGDDRFAMRIVITLGDVLHDEGDFFGDAVTLAARIEGITPPDEIYISLAAWLTASRAEVRAVIVDNFSLKGFPEPIPVYRLEQHHRTETIRNHYIVWADLRGFSKFCLMAPQVTDVERVLEKLGALVNQICRDLDGSNRFSSGDAHCLTFADAAQAISATERLIQEWSVFNDNEQVNCPMAAALHKGSLNLFKSYIYSRDINIVSALVDSGRGQTCSSILVTGAVRADLIDTAWYPRLLSVEIAPENWNHLLGIEVFDLEMP